MAPRRLLLTFFPSPRGLCRAPPPFPLLPDTKIGPSFWAALPAASLPGSPNNTPFVPLLRALSHRLVSQLKYRLLIMGSGENRGRRVGTVPVFSARELALHPGEEGTKPEKLHWPEQEFATKSLLSPGEKLIIDCENNLSHLTSGILKDIFTTGTSSYNVLLQSKEEKKNQLPKPPSPAHHRRHRKPSRSPGSPRGKEQHHRKIKVPMPLSNNSWCYLNKQPSIFVNNPLSSGIKFSSSFGVSGSGLAPRPKTKAKRHFSTLAKPKQPPTVPKNFEKGDDPAKRLCILTAIKPTNLEREKAKFFKAEFAYDPQFEYANPTVPAVLAKHGQASDRFLKQSVNIMERTLQRYGSYENFEQSTGGCLLSKTRIWSHVRKYMTKEGCLGEIVVHLTEDLLSRASMTVVNGCPTLTINVSTAREHWLEGMLRHEIGTHYFRGINNLQQPWSNWTGRKKYGLRPNNPTEEGLASIHSVLFRKDPLLWRAALLYYTVYQASQMSFSELFQDVGKFVKDPNTRWDYCVRAKRGWTDTSQPGCFNKDQVYLDGILQILRYRESIDFHLLTTLGKVSFEDVDRLKTLAVTENLRVPHFLQDSDRYMEQLQKIMEVNELTDKELQDLIF
uniref:Microtubule associated tyrosine carboxypeptidase 2 n=1 Tax=Sarcophilus harrisii TaxID=9305 RepID=G3VLR5_SARHA